MWKRLLWLKISTFKYFSLVEGFTEALGSKLKEKEKTHFRKQSCKFFAALSLFSPF